MIFLGEIINCVDSADYKPYCLMFYNHKLYLHRKSIQINYIKKNWMGDSSNILFIYNNMRNNFSIHIITINYNIQCYNRSRPTIYATCIFIFYNFQGFEVIK